MNLETLKEYLKDKVEILVEEKHNLQNKYHNIKELESLPNNQRIIKELKREYKLNNKGIKKLLTPLKSKLLELYKNRELSKINRKLTSVINDIDELKNVINSIDKGNISKNIYPNSNLIKCIIEHSIKNSNEPDEALKLILNFTNHIDKSAKNKDMIYNAEIALNTIFEINGNIKQNFTLDTALFTLNKLFDLINIDRNKPTNTLFIELLNKNIEKRYYETHSVELKKQQKQRLLKQQNAIIVLNEYIKGMKIIKSCPIKKFSSLLEQAEIDTHLCEILKNNMEAFNKKEEKRLKKEKIIKELNNYVNEENKELILSAMELTERDKGPKIDMITKAINDCLSIVRYLNLELNESEKEKSLYIFETKISTLRALFKEYKEPSINYMSKFLFLSDDNNQPTVLSDLYLIDEILYCYIYELIDKLNKDKIVDKYYDVIDDIPIYEIKNKQIRILYTKKENKKILLKIALYCNEDELITRELIDKLKLYLENNITEEDIDIAGTQAKILDVELNLDRSNIKSLVKTNKNN